MLRGLFYRIRAAIIFTRIHPHIEHAPDWTEADGKALSTFLHRTDTGAKYRRIMWWNVQQGAFNAITERQHSKFECGYASGMRGLAAVSDSLLIVKEAEETVPKDELTADLEALLP
jgi:hypothetical protein